MFKERRKYKRFKVSLEIGYAYSDDDCYIYAKSTTKDISKGGLKLEILRLIKNKSKLKVDIKLPGEKHLVSAICKLVWKKSFDEGDEHKEIGGLEFLNFRPEGRQLFDEYISGLEQSEPPEA